MCLVNKAGQRCRLWRHRRREEEGTRVQMTARSRSKNSGNERHKPVLRSATHDVIAYCFYGALPKRTAPRTNFDDSIVRSRPPSSWAIAAQLQLRRGRIRRPQCRAHRCTICKGPSLLHGPMAICMDSKRSAWALSRCMGHRQGGFWPRREEVRLRGSSGVLASRTCATDRSMANHEACGRNSGPALLRSATPPTAPGLRQLPRKGDAARCSPMCSPTTDWKARGSYSDAAAAAVAVGVGSRAPRRERARGLLRRARPGMSAMAAHSQTAGDATRKVRRPRDCWSLRARLGVERGSMAPACVRRERAGRHFLGGALLGILISALRRLEYLPRRTALRTAVPTGWLLRRAAATGRALPLPRAARQRVGAHAGGDGAPAVVAPGGGGRRLELLVGRQRPEVRMGVIW
eukprot:357002-Chlamydomonas_euryale.AAC.3